MIPALIVLDPPSGRDLLIPVLTLAFTLFQITIPHLNMVMDNKNVEYKTDIILNTLFITKLAF